MTNTTPNGDDAFKALMAIMDSMHSTEAVINMKEFILIARFIGWHGVCEQEKKINES